MTMYVAARLFAAVRSALSALPSVVFWFSPAAFTNIEIDEVYFTGSTNLATAKAQSAPNTATSIMMCSFESKT